MSRKKQPQFNLLALLSLSMQFLAAYRYVLFLMLALVLPVSDVLSQPPPPGGTGPPCWPPPCIPIDGGIGWLLAAGVAYGAKKSWDFGKKKEDTEV